MTIDRRPTTPEEIEAAFQTAPADCVAEVLDGDLFLSPRPAAPHANAATALAAELRAPFHLGRGGPGGWVILVEPELHLGPATGRAGTDKVVPDLAGWRRARMPELLSVAAFALAPDWVCEVISD